LLQIFLVFAVVVCAGAAVFDWRTGHIPNWLTLGALGLAPLLHFGIAFRSTHDRSQSLNELGLSLLGAFLCLVVPLLLYRQNAIGGGDIKLLAAIGAIGQVSIGIEIELYGFLSAAFIAPAVLAYQGKLMSTMKNSFYLLANAFLPKDKQKVIESEAMSWFRLGPAILLGAILTTYLHWKDLQ
jgi:prepilin peptidase CpaA